MQHKLLLADDSVTIQRVIELTFADEDITVIAVGDGQQAIDRIESDRPDIVLADVGMPEKSGYEVAAFVKNTPHLAHIPVLLLTGAFEPVDEKKALAVGCDGVLAKPFEPQMVITRVKELLAGAPKPRAMAPRPTTDQPSTAAGPGPVIAAGPTPVLPHAVPRVPPEEETLGVAASELPSAPDPAPEAALPALEESGIGPDASTIRISRRTPFAVPGFAAPPATPPTASEAALDDYFERLDAAFASLGQGQPHATADAGPADDAAAMATRLTGSAPATGRGMPEKPATSATPLARFLAPLELDPEFFEPETESAAAPPAPVEPRVASSAPMPAERSVDPWRSEIAPPPRPAATVEHRVVPDPSLPADRLSEDLQPTPPIVQAFSAMFAAEHGEPADFPVPSFFGAGSLSPESIDELVERVTEQVLERLSDRVVRDTVTDIVSRVTERLVREEIDRVKNTIK